MGNAMMDSNKTMMMNNTMGMNNNMNMSSTMGMNMMMIPRASMKMEKMDNGMHVMCMCSDQTSTAMMQNLCSMLSGGMVNMCMMMNGMKMMDCNMIMGMCKCEMTNDGMNITWTNADPMLCKMIQACCDCMMKMMECECTTVMSMNNTPVCCF